MVAYRILFLAGAVAALPLNINLGAYSPALVVGDGEISFGGNGDVTGLMSVLQGAAVSAANGAAANEGAARGGGGAAQRTGAAAANAAATPAAIPVVPATAPKATTIEQNQVADSSPEVATADTTLIDEAQQIAALQGMGKAVVPRQESAEETASHAKRDLASFDRALQFAEAALVKGPKIQLGTGEKGAGVGIIVDNNPTPAAAITVKKRDVPASSRVKVTTMYVRSGIPTSLQNGNRMRARSEGDNVEPRYETIQIAPAKRDANSPSSPNAVDAVNLNVNGEEGVTMTFVETIENGQDDDDA